MHILQVGPPGGRFFIGRKYLQKSRLEEIFEPWESVQFNSRNRSIQKLHNLGKTSAWFGLEEDDIQFEKSM